MACAWFAVVLSSRPPGRVTALLGWGLTGLMLGADLPVLWVSSMFFGSFLAIPLFLAMKRLALQNQSSAQGR